MMRAALEEECLLSDSTVSVHVALEGLAALGSSGRPHRCTAVRKAPRRHWTCVGPRGWRLLET